MEVDIPDDKINATILELRDKIYNLEKELKIWKEKAERLVLFDNRIRAGRARIEDFLKDLSRDLGFHWDYDREIVDELYEEK